LNRTFYKMANVGLVLSQEAKDKIE